MGHSMLMHIQISEKTVALFNVISPIRSTLYFQISAIQYLLKRKTKCKSDRTANTYLLLNKTVLFFYIKYISRSLKNSGKSERSRESETSPARSLKM